MVQIPVPFGNYTGKPVAFLSGAVVIACGGLVFETRYERTRNLAVPIVAHAVYNTLLLVLAFLTL